MHLESVNAKNVWDILRLRVEDTQRPYVAENEKSIVEAYITTISGGAVFPFGIYDGECAIGFLMIGYGTDDAWENPPAVAEGNYSLWRLMIDRRYQGKGYGRAAIRLALDFIRTWPCGKAEYCWLSYEPENARARELYRSMGFCETGERDGNESIAVLKL